MANPTSFKMGDFPIDDPRPIKVAIIGAGYSGIVAGIRFSQRIQNLNFTIYDTNAGIGGTWYSNKYPGLKCDIPSHSYQVTFENKTDWSAFYATGEEIRQNLESMVDKYNLRPLIRLQHRLTSAQWNKTTGKWHLTIRRSKDLEPKMTSNGALSSPTYDHWEEINDQVDVLFLGVGCLSRWSWPDIKGLNTFSGKVIHSAQWNTVEHKNGWKDKKVGVIGVGSSAIQIVASLQPNVKHLYNYVRGKTWISSIFVRDQLLKLGGSETSDDYIFTEKDKESFRDPEYYQKVRSDIEHDLNMAHPATLLGNPIAEFARDEFRESMIKRLARRPWIAEHIIPDFGVACRRLTPGPGYLEALCADNVSFIPALIKQVTPGGIETANNKFQDLDIIVCATGYDTNFDLGFTVTGKYGQTLKDHNSPHPKTYLSVAVDGFPNMFQSLGPNAGVGSGNLLLVMERQIDYAVAATLKIQRERIKSMDPKPEAVEDFERWIESYFPKTVFGTKCRSWYKAGKTEGRVVALWPGSPIHAARALAHPRWEDYNYELIGGATNRFYWFGDGNSVTDIKEDADKAWYLKPENIDYPPVPTKAPNARL